MAEPAAPAKAPPVPVPALAPVSAPAPAPKAGVSVETRASLEGEIRARGLCPSWRLQEDAAGSLRLVRSFVAKSFLAAMDWMNFVAVIAEEMNHHPDLHLTHYRMMEVVVYTHDTGGLGPKDLDLAARLDAVPTSYSPKFLREHPDVKAGRVGAVGPGDAARAAAAQATE